MSTQVSFVFLVAVATVYASEGTADELEARNNILESAPEAEVGITYCSVPEDCRRFRDNAANCSDEAMCVCSAGFTGNFCLHPDVDENSREEVQLSFTWEDADCDQEREPLRQHLDEELRTGLNGTTFTVSMVCGSVHALVEVPSTVGNVGEVITVAQAAAKTATEARNLTDPILRVGLGDQTCELENALETARLGNNVCYPERCMAGFERARVGTVWECRAIAINTRDVSSDDDDDLSKTGIAVIVIGSLLFVAIIGAIVYLLTLPKVATPGDNEPANYENAHAPDHTHDVNV